MPRRRKGSFPSLRHHKASGLARVTLSGQDFYCGPWGSKAALAEYDRLVAEWLDRGRNPVGKPVENAPPHNPPFDDEDHSPARVTIAELIVKYIEYCQAYYRKHDQPTNEINAIRSAAKALCLADGREPAEEFGPLELQATQQSMIELARLVSPAH